MTDASHGDGEDQRDCLDGHEWCPGPDGETIDDVAWGGLCSSCYIRRSEEEINRRRQMEKVHCPECGTTVRKESIEEAIDVAETHDENRHGGDRTVRVNGLLLPGDEVVEAAQEAVERLSNQG